jgi:hypothetical protein
MVSHPMGFRRGNAHLFLQLQRIPVGRLDIEIRDVSAHEYRPRYVRTGQFIQSRQGDGRQVVQGNRAVIETLRLKAEEKMAETNNRAKATAPWKIIAIVILAIGGIGASTAILLMQGAAGTAPAVLVFGFVTTTIVALNGIQTRETHDLVNSTATELKEVSNKLSHAEGVTEGIKQESDMPARQTPGETK